MKDEMDKHPRFFEEEKNQISASVSIQSPLRFRAYRPTLKGFLRFFFLGEREDIDPMSIPENSWRFSVIKTNKEKPVTH